MEQGSYAEIPGPHWRKNPTADLMSLFSEKYVVVSLLARYSTKCLDDGSPDAEKSLISSLKEPPLGFSRALGAFRQRCSGEVKCSEDIVAKVITGNKRLHRIHEHAVLKNETCAWYSRAQTPWPDRPSLSHEAKVSIQRQLNDIFSRLRAIRQEGDNAFGGVCGEGGQGDACRRMRPVQGYHNDEAV
ncbi:hypothetical protein ETB97_010326 [Aspergillus alliaceus]|uniref:Uncharacterized protein n=1 Tax=Petromyces alliaceus TaxID=209559 RepID=A0A8H6E8H4_PETAA|nr:hypothetical protein ETB97_010326 [Aspergillus burnettii]